MKSKILQLSRLSLLLSSTKRDFYRKSVPPNGCGGRYFLLGEDHSFLPADIPTVSGYRVIL